MEAALLVEIPEAEKAVARHCHQFDDAAVFGIPAHMTVPFPFMPPAAMDTQVIETLAAVFATFPRFYATFQTTGWFGTNVLWLAPEPAVAFNALITYVATHFPTIRPSGADMRWSYRI